MGLGELFDDLFDDPVVRMTGTMGPYLIQSMLLVRASREIREKAGSELGLNEEEFTPCVWKLIGFLPPCR